MLVFHLNVYSNGPEDARRCWHCRSILISNGFEVGVNFQVKFLWNYWWIWLSEGKSSRTKPKEQQMKRGRDVCVYLPATGTAQLTVLLLSGPRRWWRSQPVQLPLWDETRHSHRWSKTTVGDWIQGVASKFDALQASQGHWWQKTALWCDGCFSQLRNLQ